MKINWFLLIQMFPCQNIFQYKFNKDINLNISPASSFLIFFFHSCDFWLFSSYGATLKILLIISSIIWLNCIIYSLSFFIFSLIYKILIENYCCGFVKKINWGLNQVLHLIVKLGFKNFSWGEYILTGIQKSLCLVHSSLAWLDLLFGHLLKGFCF